MEMEDKPEGLSPSFPAPADNNEPTGLYQRFISMGDAEQRLFKKIYRQLYNDIGGSVQGQRVLFGQWAVNYARLNLDLTSSVFSALTFLYSASSCGVSVVHAKEFHNAGLFPGMKFVAVCGVLSRLKEQGYIVRLSRDPARKYLQAGVTNKQWIKLTDKAITTMREAETQVNRLLLRQSYNDLTKRK